MSPTIVTLGCGALGSLFSHHLSLASARVMGLDLFQAHVDKICQQGLRLRQDGLNLSSSFQQAVIRPELAPRPDFLLVLVKGYSTHEAMMSVSRLIGPDTVIVTLQNGLGNLEVIQELYPHQEILYGLTTLTSEIIEPGVIAPKSTAQGNTDLWTTRPDQGDAVERFADLLRKGGIAGRATPRISHSIWKKLAVNCTFNGLCALTQTNCGEMIDRPGTWALFDGIADEIEQLAGLEGVELIPGSTRQYLREVGEVSRAHFPSMVSDVRNRRRTEIDNLNGAVLKRSERAGLAAPHNRQVYLQVKALEAAYLG